MADEIVANSHLHTDRIYIEPPSPNYDTDQDDAPECSGGEVNDFNRNQLLAKAEAIFVNGEVLSGIDNSDVEDEVEDDVEDDITLFKTRVFNDWKNSSFDSEFISQRIAEELEWKGKFPRDNIDDLNLGSMTPVSVFELFFDTNQDIIILSRFSSSSTRNSI